MNFNKHSNLEGQHAILSASKGYWIHDDPNKVIDRLKSHYATIIGTALHDIARKHIKYHTKLSKSDKKNVILDLLEFGIPIGIVESLDFDPMYSNLMTYVNDAIGYKMTPEVVLCYSTNFFGTADSIRFQENDNFLRIHDYKSGTLPAKIEQLEIYAALFCLEYRKKPGDIEMELRIYQNNEVIFHNPTAEDIVPIMDKIITFDKIISGLTEEG